MMSDFEMMLKTYQTAVETHLNTYFCDDLPQKQLFEAMRYSLLAGGKRIRPVLVLEFCRICGGKWEDALPAAAAIEMIHTYSLIHDDLPCMDNDDYRRGRLTNHKVYGEAQAILAGDALLTAAFQTIASASFDANTAVKLIEILASSAGEMGMVGGQILDINGENKTLAENEVHTIHRLKTGALICAACCMGAAAARADDTKMKAAKAYAEAIGLSFQIRDDMLDVLGDAKKLGKATHADENKNTFVSLYGIERCRELIAIENKKALAALDIFEDTGFLCDLTELLASREI